MLDVKKCEFEENVICDDEFGCIVAYFTYPKDMSLAAFRPEEEYGDVVSTCISLTMYEDGTCFVSASPTVADGDALSDVDWRDLSPVIDYTLDDLNELIEMSNISYPWSSK